MALKAYFAKYSSRDRAEQDCNQFLQKYRFEVTTVPDRDKQTVVLGSGTIPVMFRGALYNIPIAIQLPINYPNAAPNVRVKPTDTMVLNPHCNYISTGLVRIDYLVKWKSSNSLLGLVPELQKAFGSDVPVFAKPNPASTGSNVMPPYGGAPYVTMPTPSYTYAQSPTPTGGSVYTAPTPGNPYPATHNPYPSSNPQPPYPAQPAYNSYPPQSGYPPNPPYPYPATQPPYPYPNYQPTPVNAGYPPTNVVSNAYQQATPTTPNNGLSATQNETLLKDSLISALREKIGRRIAEHRDILRSETQSVTESLNSLQTGAAQLDSTLARLVEEERRASAALYALRERNEALNKTISEHDNGVEMNLQPDEMVQPSKPLYKQLAEAYAEEQALEDAMYHLSSALRDQVIDLESFLKEIRALGRRQFTARYLVMKCRERAGLPSI